MLIFIEQRHIDAGQVSAMTCPIALAVKDQFDCDAAVGNITATIFFEENFGGKVGYHLSEGAMEFVRSYDLGYKMSPCVVEFIRYIKAVDEMGG